MALGLSKYCLYCKRQSLFLEIVLRQHRRIKFECKELSRCDGGNQFVCSKSVKVREGARECRINFL